MLSDVFFNNVGLKSMALVSVDLQKMFSKMGGLQASKNMASVVRDIKETPIMRVGVYMDKENEGPEEAEQGFCQASLNDFNFLHAKDVPDAMISKHSANGDRTLEERFNDLDITHIAMGGFYTNWCVEASAITAIKLGFKVAVLTDCIYDFFEIGEEGISKMKNNGVIMTDSTTFRQSLLGNLHFNS